MDMLSKQIIHFLILHGVNKNEYNKRINRKTHT